jgi:hypothetical protein
MQAIWLDAVEVERSQENSLFALCFTLKFKNMLVLASLACSKSCIQVQRCLRRYEYRIYYVRKIDSILEKNNT